MCVLAVPLTQGFSPSLSLRGPSSSLSWVSGEYSGEWCPGSVALREGPVCEVYDIGRKLWIYLHRDRSEEEFGVCPAS